MATEGSGFLSLGGQPRSLDSSDGGWSGQLCPSLEGAALPRVAGGASAASAAVRLAGLSPARIRRPRAPHCSPRLFCLSLAGSSPTQDACSIFLTRVYGFPGVKNFASVPTSISRTLSPSPRNSLSSWARARAHTYTLTLSGARAHARAPRAAESPAPLSRSHSLGRPYSHRLPVATGRPLSAAAAAAAEEAAKRTAAAVRPRLAAPCPGRSPGEAEEGDAEARRSHAAPSIGLRAAGYLCSPYRRPR